MKYHTLSFLLLASIFCTSVRAQIILRDVKTQLPIPNAFFQTEDGQFGSSDGNGYLNVVLTSGKLTSSISHLSYQDTILQFTNDEQTYYLRPQSFQLPEISVSSRKPRRFRNPQHLLRMALRQIPKNYATTVQKQTAVYREMLHRNDRLINLNEAVIDLETQPYGEKHRQQKVLHNSHFRRVFRPYQLNGKKRSYAVETPEGIQQFSAFKDRYRLLQARISVSPAPDSAILSLDHGPMNAVSLDKVRLGYDYLDPSRLKDYTYQLIDTQLVNGAFCYHLRFSPADDVPTRYFGANKNHYTGVFSGSLFLSLKDLSIVRFSASNEKAIARNYVNPGAMPIPKGYTSNEVNYARNAEGKWQLSTVVANTRSVDDPELTATRVLYGAGNRAEAFDGREKVPWVYLDFYGNMTSLTRGYTPEFWHAFTRSDLYQRAVRLYAPTKDTITDAYFHKPFSYDSIKIPRAIASRPYGFIKPKKRPKDQFAWLDNPQDSATITYLKWENQYQQQFFRWNSEVVDSVSAQFSNRVQGVLPGPERSSSVDTLLRTVDGVRGFYRIKDGERTLLAATGLQEASYVLTDYAWSKGAKYFLTVSESRGYDRLLKVFDRSGKVTAKPFIDDYHWRGDTLYATGNNDKLRTAKFIRWTARDGWKTLLEEKDPTFEFRMEIPPTDELIVLRESLTTAFVYRNTGEGWVQEATAYPALLGGTGGRGRGCKVGDIEADYVADCRSTAAGTCVLAVDSARHEVWLRASGTSGWTKVPLPPGHTYVGFGSSKDGQIILDSEGVGSYGNSYRVDFSSRSLVALPSNYPPVDLAGYRDSIVWVKAKDGMSIPCQMRWKANWRNNLQGTILKVYSAYGNPYLAGHRQEDIALMNLGQVIVYVLGRGSGARGPEWYEAGRATQKIVACKDYLATVRYFYNSHPLTTTPLSGYAQSAGGPVLGFAVNEAPELFQSAVFDHAFLDVAGTMTKPDLPLTEYEYTEWGNPSDKGIQEVQLAYSPYQNIRPQVYPAMLFLAGRYDQSTPYWQIAKHVATLRKMNQGHNPVLFYTSLYGSHPGTPFGPGLDRLIERMAFVVAAGKPGGR